MAIRPLGAAFGCPVGMRIFLGLFFCYLWFRVEPPLQYHNSVPSFAWTAGFVAPFLTRIGGWVDWSAAGLAQLNYVGWLGALSWTAQAGLMGLLTSWWLRSFGVGAGSFGQIVPFGPPFVLLLLLDGYDASVLGLSLGFLAALGGGLGYAALSRGWGRGTLASRAPSDSAFPTSGPAPTQPEAQDFSRAWMGLGLRWAAGWCGAGLLFYAAGTWGCGLFVLLASLFEFVACRAWRVGLGVALSAVVAPLGFFMFGEAGVRQVFELPAEGRALVAGTVLYGLLPVMVLGRVLLVGWLGRAAGASAGRPVAPSEPLHSAVAHRSRPPGPKHPKHTVPSRREPGCGTSRGLMRWLQSAGGVRLGWAGLFLAAWVLVWLAFDTQRKAFLQISSYADQRQWDKVLAVASKLKVLNTSSELHLFRALYHTGRLSRDLFAFPVPRRFELLPGLSRGMEACRAQAAMLLELGQVNLAERLAHEALEYEGERPDLLHLLARINLLKGRPQAARVFLCALRQRPFHQAQADALLEGLRADSSGARDSELAPLRACAATTDRPGLAVPLEELLRDLLRANPRNTMASEYLLAHFLLRLDLDSFVVELGRASAAGGQELPRHYEEALLLHRQRQPAQPADGLAERIRPATVRRFEQFVARIQAGAMETVEGRRELLRVFGDTYWSYHLVEQALAGEAAPQNL